MRSYRDLAPILESAKNDVFPKDDLVVTSAGDRLDSITWDFSHDAHRGSNAGILRWDVPIVVNNIEIGKLTDERWNQLLLPIKEALYIRWKSPNKGDGQIWNSGATVYNMGLLLRQFTVWVATLGIEDIKDITDSVLHEWAKKSISLPIDPLNQRRLVTSALIPVVTGDRISASYNLKNRSYNPDYWFPKNIMIPKTINEDKIGYETIPKEILDCVIGSALSFIESYGSLILLLRDTSIQIMKNKRALSEGEWERIKVAANTDADLGPLGFIQDLKELRNAETFLETSCYIVIAFLSGARFSEVIRLKAGCCTKIETSSPAQRWRLKGVIVKGNKTPKEHVWYVTEEVSNACDIMEKFHSKLRKDCHSDMLFINRYGGKYSEKGDMFTRPASWNRRLKQFISITNPPLFDGKPWSLSTHQFRVSLAQWLVQEPYGVIGGSAQFGHSISSSKVRSSVFEGYNRQDPQFQSLIKQFETQEYLSREELISSEPVLRGQAGNLIVEQRSAAVQARLSRDVKPLIQSRIEDNITRKLESKHKKIGRPIYQSPTALCMFRPESSACLEGVPENERHMPALHKCKPMDCSHSVVTRIQLPMYLEPAQAYWADLQRKDISNGQSETCRSELIRLKDSLLPFLPLLEQESVKLKLTSSNMDSRESSAVEIKKRLNTVSNQILTIRKIYSDEC